MSPHCHVKSKKIVFNNKSSVAFTDATGQESKTLRLFISRIRNSLIPALQLQLKITNRNWILHCDKKQDTKLMPITSPNINRFSKFFHWQTQW